MLAGNIPGWDSYPGQPGAIGLPVSVPHHSATAQHNSTQTDVGYLNVTYGSSVYTMLYSRYLPLLTIVKSGRLCKKS